MKKVFQRKIVMIGFGSIGQAVLPLLFKHYDLSSKSIQIINPIRAENALALKYDIHAVESALTPTNYEQLLGEFLHKDDVLLNLSVNVSSSDLLELCQKIGALYLDTCIEPWEGCYTDASLSSSLRSNYAFRESALKLKDKYKKGPTALLAHGANPGIVSHFVKRAMINLAKDFGIYDKRPQSKEEWARLAQKLEIKTIHIAECDSQKSSQPRKPHEFCNTWSVEGFICEGAQPAELGWGTHEKHLPSDASRHDFGCQAAIYLNRPGLDTRIRSWTPHGGPMQAMLVTHNEAISIADFFTCRDNDNVSYRPTVHYSYKPCENALLSIQEMIGNNWQAPVEKRIQKHDITHGADELGVLLMGHRKGAYWFGSQLSIEEARSIEPSNSATSLQIASGILSGLVYIIEHPQLGIIEAEEMDEDFVLEVAAPYLGQLVGVYTDWTPLKNRFSLFPEQIDKDDPWQFQNFRMN